jgi:hypothetical protein
MTMDVSRMLDILRDRQLLTDTCRAALVVGSAARGWSNTKSDVDVYLICTEPWSGRPSMEAPLPVDPPVVQWEAFYADGRGWDVSCWLDRQIDQMLAKVSWAEFDQAQAASGDVLAMREERFLERLPTCVALLGDEWLARRRGELDSSAFRSMLITRSLGDAARFVEDALGQMEAGDLTSAVLSARIAFGHAVDALLEERGEYGSHAPKWRARRFQIVRPKALSFDRYWELETMRTFDPADPSGWINEILTLCQDLSLKVEV